MGTAFGICEPADGVALCLIVSWEKNFYISRIKTFFWLFLVWWNGEVPCEAAAPPTPVKLFSC